MAKLAFPSDHTTASRVYIGTHYVGDVLGGAVTGIVAAFVVRAAYREGSKLDRLVTSIL
jgi:undecaprenyl-diphosphatase